MHDRETFESFAKVCQEGNMRRHLSALNSHFAKAAALSVPPEPSIFAEAMLLLDPTCGGNPQRCAYCSKTPRTDWDHLVGAVLDLEPSGFGNHLGNLVPACRECNGPKLNLPWLEWYTHKFGPLKSGTDAYERARRIAYYQRFYTYSPMTMDRLKQVAPNTWARFRQSTDDVLLALEALAEIADEMRGIAAQQAGLPVSNDRLSRRPSLRDLQRESAETEMDWLVRRRPRLTRLLDDMTNWECLANEYEEHVLHLYRTVPHPDDPSAEQLLDIKDEPFCPLPATLSCPVHGDRR